MDTVDLFLHPVRVRIVHAMYDGSARTTSELCALLPDVSQATVYRHVGLLVGGGVLAIEGEERVRGAVERRYVLRRGKTVIDAETTASMSTEDYRRSFAVSVATLQAEFNAYLDREGADPVRDLVAIRQHALWLSRDELVALIDDVRDVLLARVGNEPSPERVRHLLGLTLFPGETPLPQTPDA
ncbi:helix-turn-helix domain-containing protein [Embleya hyalina]|uniref:Transcriptional regulator n=1 Tax=Embleya hyalina TaxID=516124 RepID=A0A401YEN4_9ACTN|nr:helix-turn-helix domain-containing protein [Embleya hyalina]GCD93062.1 transcriptional regulator [Embleya hyalina]